MSDRPRPSPRPRSTPSRARRLTLPVPTLTVFGVLALLLWVNAAVNSFRFNVALAVLASVPVAVLVARAALAARAPGTTH